MDGMKYDKVVEMNQKIGKQNARIVEKEIERMIENGERVTVAALQRYTGFSNSFFYKNKLVREILYEAIRKQNQCYKNNLTSMCTQQEIEENDKNGYNYKIENGCIIPLDEKGREYPCHIESKGQRT